MNTSAFFQSTSGWGSVMAQHVKPPFVMPASYIRVHIKYYLLHIPPSFLAMCLGKPWVTARVLPPL